MKKIVVGIDFSSGSEAAIRAAMRLARHTGAEVCLVHCGVVPEHPVGIPHGLETTADAYNKILAEHLASDRARLEELHQRLSGQGVVVSQLVTDGFADTTLVKVADELGAELMVLGTHGRTGVKRFLLGSIAERAVRLAGCNVMVARPADGTGPYQRILVPTDFSPSARRALVTALSLAAPGATIDLLHCWQP
ncbi:MAG TPA: universal stress protein, partial [Kofleriaceae bacterium]|nr:universal stress protein [Kofleriaceae bacterium]